MRTPFPKLAAIFVAGTAALTPAATFADTTPSPFTIGAPASATPQPFATDAQTLSFSGERQKRTIVFVAQADQLAGPVTLLLNLQSAISDAPEASHLNVTINGRDLGTLQLQPGAPYNAQLTVPAGLVQPGYNALGLSIDQAHRVDCSIQATYELWTRIDPKLSGFIYAAPGAQNGAESVIAAARSDNGVTPIHAVLPTGADRNELIKAIEALSVSAAFDRPKVDFGPDLVSGNGINVVVGTAAQVGSLLQGHVNAPLHDGLNIVRGDAGQTVLAILGEDAKSLDSQIASLAAPNSAFDVGAPEGIAAVNALRGPALDDNSKISFAQLGLDDRAFAGRYLRQSAQFRMPDDFYPADYARAGIHLDALYARGLSAGSQLLIKLNDKTVATVPLSGGRTGQINDQILPISMSAFRPGLNDLSVEAMLPSASDAVCDPTQLAAQPGRLQIAGNSYLELPDLARIGRFPDLAAIGQSVTGNGGGNALDVVADPADPLALDAAGTFLAKLAYASNRVIDAKFVGTSYAPTNPTIAFGGYSAIPPSLASQANVDLSGTVQALPPVAQPVDSLSSATSWDRQLIDAAAVLGDYDTAQAGNVSRGAASSLYGLAASFGINADFLRPREQSFQPDGNTKLLVTQQANAVGVPLTLVASPKSGDLAVAIGGLTDPVAWTGLAGATTTFGDNRQVLQTAYTSGTQLFATTPPSVSNSRLIAAGWLSNNAAVYVVLLLAVAGLLGLNTFLVLLQGRKRR